MWLSVVSVGRSVGGTASVLQARRTGFRSCKTSLTDNPTRGRELVYITSRSRRSQARHGIGELSSRQGDGTRLFGAASTHCRPTEYVHV